MGFLFRTTQGHNTYKVTITEKKYMISLLLLPLMTGLFGWLLTWFFVKSLFFPAKPITIGKFKWNAGLYELIDKFPLDTILPTDGSDNSSFDSVLPFIDKQLDDFFKHKLSEKMPIVSMFIGEKTVTQLKEVFLEELSTLFPSLVSKLAEEAKINLLQNLQKKWKPIIEPKLLEATKNSRWAAFFLGFFWGILILLLMH